jgi:hypothetical protein
MKKLFFIILTFFFTNNCFCQEKNNDYLNSSYLKIENQELKNDLSSFVHANKTIPIINSKKQLKKYKFVQSSEKDYFNSTNYKNLFARIIFNKIDSTSKLCISENENNLIDSISQLEIKEIYLERTNNIFVPNSAFCDLLIKNSNNYIKNEVIPSYFMYKSKKTENVYLYFIYNNGVEDYEITFIFNRSFYLGRIIDPIQL